MKILYLTARQPYPVIKGDQIIAYEQIRELSKQHEIYLISFYEEGLKELEEELSKYCKKLYLFKHSKITKLISALKTLYNFNSIQANCFYRLNIKEKIDRIYKEINPDIVHVQSFRMAEYFRKSNINKSIDLIDAYSLNMKKRAQTSSILKPLWCLEYFLLKRYEKKILRDYKIKTIVADRDKEYFNDSSIVVNPNGTSFNANCDAVGVVDNLDIVFHGNMSYYPNIEAAEYIITELLDDIRVINNNCKFYIVGGNPSEKIMEYANEDKIIVTGYVKDIQKYISKCKVAIYPIFSATGMQNKVLEAMGSGVPCIISPQCETGINGLKHGENVLVAKDKMEYINFYKLLTSDSELYSKLRINGCEFARKNYSWEKNCNILEQLWNNK